MKTSYERILITNKNHLRIIQFNDPATNNAWNKSTYQDIIDILNETSNDDSISIVVLTGSNDFYSSGNDVAELTKTMKHLNIKKSMNIFKYMQPIVTDLIRAFINFPKLLIVLLNGPCIGIAATTAILCDIIYMNDKAFFYTPFSLYGVCAEGCSSYTFTRMMGKSMATEMLMLNHKLSADEALKYNVIAKIYNDVELDTKIWPKIERFSTLPMQSLTITKRLMKKFEIIDLEMAQQLETEALINEIDDLVFTKAINKLVSDSKL